jgi:GTP-binding protein HflX
MIESHDPRPLQALLVGISEADPLQAEASLRELKALVKNLGWEAPGSVMVKLRQKTPDLLIGSGKAAEIAARAQDMAADLIVFDTELSPTHQRNWEQLSGKAVADRPGIIIDIFASRAQTKEAQLQVELAELEYQLPRLQASYTNLSLARQRGGAYGTRGGGETKLELDRRVIKDRIARLQDELEVVASQRATLRKQRRDQNTPVISLVGYTNAGKSSLLTALTGADVLVKDALFATLDPTARKLSLPAGMDTVLVDTVGFIRNLPHRLIEAFKATLEEVRQSDLLVQILDASDPEALLHYHTTMQVLGELEASNKPMLVVLNKWDLVAGDPDCRDHRESLLLRFPEAVRISAKLGEGLDSFLDTLGAKLNENRPCHYVVVPWERGDILAALHRGGQVLAQEHLEDGIEVKAFLDDRLLQYLPKQGLKISTSPSRLVT